jgi:hypothetical protein
MMPCFVYRFEKQHDVRRRLHDLVIAKRPGAGVGSAEPRHTVGQAPFDVREIFGSLVWTPAHRVGRRPSLLPFGCHEGIRPSGGSMTSDVRLSNSRSIISDVVPVAVCS